MSFSGYERGSRLTSNHVLFEKFPPGHVILGFGTTGNGCMSESQMIGAYLGGSNLPGIDPVVIGSRAPYEG